MEISLAWPRRSRDQDEGYHEIQFQSDEKVQLVTFNENGQLVGQFMHMSFMGQKLETTGDRATVDPDAIWKSHRERAYKKELAESWHEHYCEPDCSPDEMGDENYAKIRRNELKAEREEEAAKREERMEIKRRRYKEDMMEKGHASDEIDSTKCSEDEESLSETDWFDLI